MTFLIGCNTATNPGGNDVQDIKIYFSPADNCDVQIVNLINNAKSELNIAVYSFNRPNIADAVIQAYERGVAVRVVFDESQLTGPNSKQTYLQDAGVPVRKDKPGSAAYSQMHNKFAIIDKRIVITGSYNWTTNATTNNDENMLVITSPDTAAAYNTEFEKIWAHATDLTSG
ncbi:MAG: phospholipase D-like domain-containing protein [Treponema sp.]|nr:phospholipase D-like domain-containing protein [Treponema sp.]